jgi:predicted nucleotidyltransferase
MLDLSASTAPDLVAAAAVLARLDVRAATAGIDYLVVGAAARNIQSLALLGRLPPRDTNDVDIAVAVDGWEQYRTLVSGLTPTRGAHRFLLDGAPVDIVPYGGVQDADGTVLLPDDHRVTVVGLAEVRAGADLARLPARVADGPADSTDADQALVVPVPTVAGLVALKLLAWGDRYVLTRRDALDLAEILSWPTDPAGNLHDELYEEHIALLEHYGFDPSNAGAHLLGAQVARLLGPVAAAVADLLADEARSYRLAADMGGVAAIRRDQLAALLAGLLSELRPAPGS